MSDPKTYARAILDADLEVAHAEVNLAAMKDHGSITDVRDAAARVREKRAALTEARKPLEAALILTRSMSDNVALQVSYAIIEGETWPYTREGIEAHTEWQPTTEGWTTP